MKTLIAFTVAAGLLAGFATAQTVTTENAAGYAKVVCAKGLTLLANPFDTFDGTTPTVSDLMGDTFPQSTKVYVYDPASQSYGAPSSYSLDPFTFAFSWAPDFQVPRGQGFWCEIPDNAPNATYDWYAHGQVPYSGSAGDSTAVALNDGLTMMSLSYPVSRTIQAVTGTAGGQLSPAQSDKIHEWTGSGFKTHSYSLDPFTFTSSWTTGGGASDFVFTPGVGVFFDSQNNKSWTQQKSDYYNWP